MYLGIDGTKQEITLGKDMKKNDLKFDLYNMKWECPSSRPCTVE